ncbi:zinc finger CCCH domain-containing protein 42, partial [Tanacetum coccineum]
SLTTGLTGMGTGMMAPKMLLAYSGLELRYGEIVDVNLVRDKGTGKSKGFSFVAYEDQRRTVLAVDNLNGSQVLGRTIRVNHVPNTKRKKKRMRRRSNGKERNVEFAVLSKEVTVPVELDANFLIMRK